MIKQMNPTDWDGERLVFAMCEDEIYTIENKKFEMLGRLEKVRCGRFMQWCLFLDKDCYLSPGCNDEVREMQKILGGIDRKRYAKQKERCSFHKTGVSK